MAGIVYQIIKLKRCVPSLVDLPTASLLNIAVVSKKSAVAITVTIVAAVFIFILFIFLQINSITTKRQAHFGL